MSSYTHDRNGQCRHIRTAGIGVDTHCADCGHCLTADDHMWCRQTPCPAVPTEPAAFILTADRDDVTIQSIRSLAGWAESRGPGEALPDAVRAILAVLADGGTVRVTFGA